MIMKLLRMHRGPPHVSKFTGSHKPFRYSVRGLLLCVCAYVHVLCVFISIHIYLRGEVYSDILRYIFERIFCLY